MEAIEEGHPRVFISYSHDSDDHRQRVYELSQRLREQGIDCRIDRYEESPRQGWPQWMIDQIEDADSVLVVCTETYARRARGKEAAGTGLGATWEGAIITQLLYEQASSTFVPVVFSSADTKHIPVWLRGATHYDLGRADGYERLYRRLTGRKESVPRPLGRLAAGAAGARIRYSRLVPTAELAGAEGEFFSIAFSPDGRLIAGGSSEVVFVWDREALDEPIHVLEEPEGYVYSVAFSHDGKLAAGGEDHVVRVWDLGSGRLIWEDDEERHTDAVYSVAFSASDEDLVSGGYDRLVNLWNAATGQFQRDLPRPSRVTSVAFSPVRDLVALGSLDDTVTLWDIRAGEEHVLRGHTSSVETVAFSPDGRLLASAGLDKTVRVWDVAKRKLKWARKEHEYLVRAVAFSPDGATLASASWDKTVKLWDVDEETLEETLPWTKKRGAHTDWIWSAAFSSRDVLLATGGSDGKIILWSPEPAPE